LWRELTPAQRIAVLRHEISHYLRGDAWKSLLVRLLALPQWFNPLAWWAVRHFDEFAEWACDEVAHGAIDEQRIDHANALLRLCETAAPHAPYSAAWRTRSISTRVKRLLASGMMEDSLMKKLLLLTVALGWIGFGAVRLEFVARAQMPIAVDAAAPVDQPIDVGKKPVDLYGDPLPEGAVARLGSIRLRHGSMVSRLAVSPDGKTLATWTGSTLSLWELPTGKLLRRENLGAGNIFLLIWFNNGKSLALIGDHKYNFYLWDFANPAKPPPVIARPPASGEAKTGVNNEDYARFAVSPDGKLLAAGTAGGNDINRSVQFFEVETGLWLADQKKPHKITTKRGDISWLSFAPDAKSLLAISRETGRRGTRAGQTRSAESHALTVYDVAAAKPLRQFDVPAVMYQGTNRSATMSPDGKTVAIGTEKGPIHIFDLSLGKETARMTGHEKGTMCLAFSSDANSLVTGGRDKTVRHWNLKTGKQIKELGNHHSWVEAVAVLSDGKTAVSGGQDSRTRLWNMESEKLIESTTGHEHRILGVAVSRDGRKVITGSADRTLRVWDTVTGRMLRKFESPGWILWLVLHPDEKLVFTGNAQRESLTLLQQDVLTGKTIRQFGGKLLRGVYSHGLSISANGKLLVSAHETDNSVRIWDAANCCGNSCTKEIKGSGASQSRPTGKPSPRRTRHVYSMIGRSSGSGIPRLETHGVQSTSTEGRPIASPSRPTARRSSPPVEVRRIGTHPLLYESGTWPTVDCCRTLGVPTIGALSIPQRPQQTASI
jgi:WD40 repeat protein